MNAVKFRQFGPFIAGVPVDGQVFGVDQTFRFRFYGIVLRHFAVGLYIPRTRNTYEYEATDGEHT